MTRRARILPRVAMRPVPAPPRAGLHGRLLNGRQMGRAALRRSPPLPLSPQAAGPLTTLARHTLHPPTRWPARSWTWCTSTTRARTCCRAASRAPSCRRRWRRRLASWRRCAGVRARARGERGTLHDWGPAGQADCRPAVPPCQTALERSRGREGAQTVCSGLLPPHPARHPRHCLACGRQPPTSRTSCAAKRSCGATAWPRGTHSGCRPALTRWVGSEPHGARACCARCLPALRAGSSPAAGPPVATALARPPLPRRAPGSPLCSAPRPPPALTPHLDPSH